MNAPLIFHVDQDSPEWREARRGIPTASKFGTIVGVKKDAREKVTRAEYMRKLAGEIITGELMEEYQSAAMERGKEMEPEARDFYALATGADLERVGFIRNYEAGCSPDSLVGTDGGLEIKSAAAHIQIERLIRNDLPPEHRWQVQGNIWLADRSWWDFVSYCPRLPTLIVRVPRDDGTIATIAGAVKQFNDELGELVERVRRYGQPMERAA